jgi:hypothetical protein
MDMEKEKPLFSVTAADCDWSYTKGSGAGGQKRNKTSRSQFDNKQDAFVKMVKTDVFQKWLTLEFMRHSGQMAEIDRKVDREMSNKKNFKIEVKDDKKWVEVEESELSD